MDVNGSSARKIYPFGQYEIIETTGVGGMGIVYRARDAHLGRDVALKILRDDLRAQPRVVARFKREAEAIASLDHPNIVEIYSVGAIGKIPYIAMEFVEGQPLSLVLQRAGKLPWQEVLDIAGDVAGALGAAHEKGVIHRDIKPGNILLDNSGKATVTDFGIAKVLRATTQLTVDGRRLGTPQYMCPERCQNKSITPASDFYSLGVLMFQAISGRLPHDAHTPVELIRKIAVEAPARLRHYIDVPENVERLVAYLLEKDPRNRPPNAEVLRAAIARVKRGESLDARADELASAIANFRDALPPASTPAEPTPAPWRDTRALPERLAGAWFRLSRRVRLGAAAALLTGLIALGAWGALAVQGRATHAELPLGMSQGVERWRHGAGVARMRDERPGVRVAIIDLPDFAARELAWGGSALGAVVQLDARADSRWDAHRAVFHYDPVHDRAAVLEAPLPAREASAFQLAPVSGSGYWLRAGGALLTRDAAQNGRWTRVSDARVGAAAIHPDGDSFALAQDAMGRDRWRLVQARLDAPERKTGMTPEGAPISGLAYAPDGARIAYLRETGRGLAQLRLIAPESLEHPVEAEPAPLREARMELPRAPFRPDGGAILLIEIDEFGEQGAVALSLADNRALSIPGVAKYAAWLPDGRGLLISAPDRAGRLQLWRVDLDDPARREQLTHLGAGLALEPLITPDGQYAIAALADSPALVRVSL